VIAQQYIALSGQCRENGVVRLEPSAKNERSLLARQRGEFVLELDMQIERSVQNPRTTATRAISAYCLVRCLCHPWVCREIKVIV